MFTQLLINTNEIAEVIIAPKPSYRSRDTNNDCALLIRNLNALEACRSKRCAKLSAKRLCKAYSQIFTFNERLYFFIGKEKFRGKFVGFNFMFRRAFPP